MSGEAAPFVSVVVPTRNERRSIRACLDSILATDHPADRMEVVVVDGRSRDGTRDILRRYAEEDGRVRTLDNPERRTPVALNRGVEAARGDVILRMDAHTVYPPDYVPRCVEGLERHDADNVGGVWEIQPAEDTPTGRALAAVYGHPFGVGDAWYRTGVDAPREVDTVPFGCWRREVFEELGGFDERLDRAQDLEFNLRLKRAGGRVVLDPSIHSRYLARSTLRKDLPHRARSGFWTLYALRFGDRSFSRRHLVPLGALATGSALAAAALAGSVPAGSALALLAALYVAADVASAARIGADEGAGVGLRAAVIFPALHLSYALGQAAGLAAAAARRALDRLPGAPDLPETTGRGADEAPGPPAGGEAEAGGEARAGAEAPAERPTRRETVP